MKPKPKIETNNTIDLLSRTTQNLNSYQQDLLNTVRSINSKSNSNPNIFWKEVLKQKYTQDSPLKRRQQKNMEIATALQKQNQIILSKYYKPQNNQSKSQQTLLLNQLVAKINPSNEINMFKQSQPSSIDPRPLTSKINQTNSAQNRRQESIGSKYQNVYDGIYQKPKKVHSHQISPVHSRQLSLQQPQSITNRVQKYFESIKFNTEDVQFQYYLGKIKAVFTQPCKDDYFSSLYRDHFFQTYQGIYAASHLRLADPNDFKRKAVKIKRKEQHIDKISVIFDLDETLVHCNESILQKSDFHLNIKVSPNLMVKAGVNIRPGAIELLESLVEHFEIIVFTASHQCYAKQVLDYLDPENKLISHRFFRDSCCQTTGSMYTKDLRIFDRPLSQMVLVDNASYNYAWQLDNGIPIVPFYDNKDDRELWGLQTYLMGMRGVSDVREYNRNKLKLNQFYDASSAAGVFEKLFQQKMEI
ncbi:unnamed protein product (macronuclear) [Paramecium tetraurelia]|uniref:FCP1 homology domain-containing protein n=1 Tax=Paramecium tetraurelia TaxID=5888 RepID=A0CUQ0_PARTE|nr:uncharacterized protein GSPATT00010717001 [Paramecium tetraurelia]CAK74517.1 unnamed protein product [Paramecium tetraurelia]|eukprot:XP_001441914.1 hypothetical protein (macronuclear) [Paramecium tetraurelia strain d4-2]